LPRSERQRRSRGSGGTFARLKGEILTLRTAIHLMELNPTLEGSLNVPNLERQEYVMLPPQIAASMLDGLSRDPNAAVETGTDAFVTLHLRTVDALKGYVKMVEKAEPEFRPVARRFHDLHARHAAALAGKLATMGVAVDPDGSLMGTINETVVGLRAFFDEIDEDVMSNIRNGEGHVLDAFDEVQKVDLSPEDASDVSAMRDELVALLDETRGLD
jgi:hypothetical protein